MKNITSQNKLNRTGARVASPSSGVRPGARALNLELPTSFGFRIFVGALCLLAGSSLFTNSAYATSYLNVSSSGSVSFGSIRPTSSGTSSTGSDTLTVHTDCSTGYSVYVSGQNGKDTNLTNGSASSDNIISTSSNAIGSAGSLNSNTWGLNYENTGAYVGLPTYDDALVAALTTKSNVEESSTVDIYYGIKVNTAITPGTYTGDVLYTVLMDSSCLAYTVVFDANGGSGEMSNQSIMAGTKTALDENDFTRDGYTFLGWSTKANGKTETAVDGVGTEADVDYSDKAEVTDLASGGSSITLYAIWGEEAEPMQNWTGCSALPAGRTATLVDTRDGTKYRVKKFVDGGNCWMIDNLVLGYDKSYALTQVDTNISDSDTYYIPKAGYQGSITSSSTVNSTTTVTFSSSSDNQGRVQYRAAGSAGDQSSVSGYTLTQNTGYYNFYTATLGCSYYGGGTSCVSGYTTRDICPKNWQLPAGGSSTTKSWVALDKELNGSSAGSNRTDTTARDKFLNTADFFYSGYYNNSSLYNVGSYGYWWSSTVRNTNYGYYLRLDSDGNVYPQRDRADKYFGFAVRCVAKYDSVDGTMQNFDASTFSTTVGTSANLVDTRDGKVYAVKRLPDGKVWMMQNLTIGMDGAKTLTPADTNIDNDTTYYLPPAGKQGSSVIDDPSTLLASDAANFGDTDNRAKTQFRSKDPNILNDSDTGYYNFYTATLGFSFAGDSIMNGSSTRDICPNGWRLPWASDSGNTDGAGGDFMVLAKSYNSSASWAGNVLKTDDAIINNAMHLDSASPLAVSSQNSNAGFAYTGYHEGESIYSVDSAGIYHTSSVHGIGGFGVYALWLSSSSITPQGSNDEYASAAVRCIAQNKYVINYSSNGADSGAPSKVTEGIVYDGRSVTLPAVGTMAKSGYKFSGWALSPDSNVVVFTAEEKITVSALLAAASSANQDTMSSFTITVYPVWLSVIPDDGNIGSMQGTACAKLTPGHTAIMTDSRDGRSYTVYRIPTGQTYKDSDTIANIAGKCFMTQDLAFGYNSASDLSLDASASAGSGVVRYVDATNSGSGWQSGWSNNKITNLQYTYGPDPAYESYTSHSYYSYGAAQIVCPKGWRVPTSDEYASNNLWWGNSTTGLAAMFGNDATGSKALQMSPYNFIRGGRFLGSWSNQGSFGYYWSSTIGGSNQDRGYYLHFNSGYIRQNVEYGDLSEGFSVRCIAD